MNEGVDFTFKKCYYNLYHCVAEGGVMMANIKSAKKRIKVNATKTMQNKATKSNLKSVLKDAEAAIENKADNTEAAITLAIKKVDQAAAKGLLHKNLASRRKSSLTRKLNAIG